MVIKEDLLEKREYQIKIAQSALNQNTLVVLPTGMGKTIIALMVAAKRIEAFPEKKVLILAPTKPLAEQHKKTFENFLEVSEISLITGKIKKEKRMEIYKNSKIISATPQTIQNDLKSNSISLKDFSLVIFDECHRAVKDYSYPFIAKIYLNQAEDPLILGLTASPGSDKERIEEVKKNLFIKKVELRTEKDYDVVKYVMPIKKEWIYVELDENIKNIREILKRYLENNLEWLKNQNFLKGRFKIKDLIKIQQGLIEDYRKNRSKNLMPYIIKISEILKINHAIELLETQGLISLKEYLEKISKSKKFLDRIISKKDEILKVRFIIENLKGIDHPKMEKLIEIVENILKDNQKIIIFANFRTSVERICKFLKEKGINAYPFFGQARKEKKGMSQKEQLKILDNFKKGEFNVLVSTSIGEEGIDVPKVDYVIFYEPIASEIRAIQRRGRVGRSYAGKLIFLITKGTRDEAYYWTSFRKEKKMKSILKEMKEIKRESLKDWIW